jgi:hypothetical protein
MNTYSHVLPALQADVAAKLDRSSAVSASVRISRDRKRSEAAKSRQEKW